MPSEPTPEMRAIWAYEASRRDDAGVKALVAQLLESDNWRVAKVAGQYAKGLLAFAEFEQKVRELLDT